jgi:hypothetical protein
MQSTTQVNQPIRSYLTIYDLLNHSMRPLTWPYFDLILRTLRLANHLCLHTFKEVESKRGKILSQKSRIIHNCNISEYFKKEFYRC